jgi:hypothetical protein
MNPEIVLTFLGYAALVYVVALLVLKMMDATRVVVKWLRDESEPSEREPLFFCQYHDRAFYDREEAYLHAREYHNAPREGDAWEMTYSGGENRRV